MTTEAIARLYKTVRLADPSHQALYGNDGFVRVEFERMQDDRAIYSCYTSMAVDSFIGRLHDCWLTNFCL